MHRDAAKGLACMYERLRVNSSGNSRRNNNKRVSRRGGNDDESSVYTLEQTCRGTSTQGYYTPWARLRMSRAAVVTFFFSCSVCVASSLFFIFSSHLSADLEKRRHLKKRGKVSERAAPHESACGKKNQSSCSCTSLPLFFFTSTCLLFTQQRGLSSGKKN